MKGATNGLPNTKPIVYTNPTYEDFASIPTDAVWVYHIKSGGTVGTIQGVGIPGKGVTGTISGLYSYDYYITGFYVYTNSIYIYGIKVYGTTISTISGSGQSFSFIPSGTLHVFPNGGGN